MDKHYGVITFILKDLFWRRPRKAILFAIIKIITIFIETKFKGSKKVKRIWNYLSKSNLYLYFLI